MPIQPKIKPSKYGSEFNVKTLDKLVEDSLKLYNEMGEKLAKEGHILVNKKTGGRSVNPKYTVQCRARDFVVQSWARKYQTNQASSSSGPKNHFDDVDLGE